MMEIPPPPKANLPPSYSPESSPTPQAYKHSRGVVPLFLFLLVFLSWHVYQVAVPPPARLSASKKTAVKNAPAKVADAEDSDPTQEILMSDLLAKAAFAAAPSSKTPIAPMPQILTRALKSAEGLQAGSDNAPGAARRVILLRALLDQPTPLAAAKNSPDPRAAFVSALPPETPKADRERYAREGKLWETVFAGGRLSPKQIEAAETQIRAMPSLRWWTYPALAALYKTQGDLSEASRYSAQARDRALPTLAPALLLFLFRVVLLLAGALLLLYSIVRAIQAYAASPGDSVLPSIWPAVPAAVSPETRRLDAGALLGVFVLYLLTMEALRLTLGGFDGFGVRHALRFGGLLGSFREQLQTLPSARRDAFSIVLQSVVYVLSAVPATLTLLVLAKRRGASLADEIGWNRRRFGPNLLFGLGGYAMGTALMTAVALTARVAFARAPAPPNPIIGLMINASGLLLPVLLILLTAVAAPLVEELMFRGVFYQAVRQRVGVWPAIILTGVMFGFVHPVGIAEMFALATLGGVFAWMAETRQSLVPSIFAHFLQNFMTTALLLLILAG